MGLLIGLDFHVQFFLPRSGESLFTEKLVLGGTNFGGSIFTTILPTVRYNSIFANAEKTYISV